MNYSKVHTGSIQHGMGGGHGRGRGSERGRRERALGDAPIKGRGSAYRPGVFSLNKTFLHLRTCDFLLHVTITEALL